MAENDSAEEMTPTGTVDYAEEMLVKRFPERVVAVKYQNIPAYKWDGAGSERGGVSDYLNFERIIFAESDGLPDKEILAISVGRNKGGMDSKRPIIIDDGGGLRIPYIPKMYGVLRVIVPRDFSEEVLERQK